MEVREAADTACMAGCFGCRSAELVELVQVTLSSMAEGEGLDLELAVPEDSDMQELTGLVDESFQRAIQARPNATSRVFQAKTCSEIL